MVKRKILKEACVESLQEAVIAEKLGADRIELCADLHLGGTTPAYNTVERAVRILHIPVMVMIRPRGGNFIYDHTEIRMMKQNIDICKDLNVMGVVFGFLTEHNEVDKELTADITGYALPLQITFHKAIDETKDPVSEARILSGMPGITRILTSGGAKTAMEGAAVINNMMEASREKTIILAAGSITKDNLEKITELIPAREFHGRRIVGNLK